ncbi:MAG TPA: glycosyltransferase family A protein [Acidimicrobiales bacterium]|nr:glycosyltransferase family A protein [Acidimicrobiales bacterium]
MTVNIAVKNRRAMLAACLDGLARQTFRDFDVVVVDNGSTDGTPDEARAPRNFDVKVLTELGSLGAVRNAGVHASDGEIVAFVDSDCVPTPTWLAAGIAAFDDASVTTVQGMTLPDPAAPRGRWDATQEITSFSGRYEACNLFYRRDALVAAGGFDEAIGFFGEDSMAGWAVRRLGGQEGFAADAVVHHAVTYPGLRWHLRRCLRYGNWNKLVRRYPEMRQLFWRRYVMRQSHLQTLLVFPMLWRHRPYTWRRRDAIVDAAGGVLFDLAIEVALLWGSIREHTLVL